MTFACTNTPGTLSMSDNLWPNSLAHCTHSSMLTFCTGIKGHTSIAPIRGCSPVQKHHFYKLYSCEKWHVYICYCLHSCTWVFGHVYEFKRNTGGIQHPLNDSHGWAHKSVHCPVCWRTWVDVQQTAALRGRDSIGYGINDLDIIYWLKYCIGQNFV